MIINNNISYRGKKKRQRSKIIKRMMIMIKTMMIMLMIILNHSVITIAFIDSESKSTTEEFCDRTENLNECVMDEKWLNEEMIKVGDNERHPSLEM